MLVLLKLGGSLITDKDTPRTPRLEVLDRLIGEISRALHSNPSLKLVVGHGSGSFGHQAGKIYNTRDGVDNSQQWRGFAQVWYDARSLNQIVIEHLHQAGIPLIAFPPSAAVIARDSKVLSWDLYPMEQALNSGLVPVINGDVAFDTHKNGTILSTEDLMIFLAKALMPDRILLAGTESGVWADFPANQHLVQTIQPADQEQLKPLLSGSASVDVTGGMSEKVRLMLTLVEDHPKLKVSIFSGEEPGNLFYALMGGTPGTTIQAN